MFAPWGLAHRAGARDIIASEDEHRGGSGRVQVAETGCREGLRFGLHDWARHALAPLGQSPAAHHLHILDALQRVSDGETRRLMLLLPPGSAKSTYASRLFPAWWFARHPGSAVIAASHTAGLSGHFGRGVRGLIDEHATKLGVRVRADARASGCFMTDQGGEYFSIGVHGAVTGRRADLALIDDPVRSVAEAESYSAREHLWNWFGSELVTRLKPGGRIVLVMTRWHVDDLAGRLVGQQGWEVVRLPALAEPGDPLGRALGEALWPAWEDRAALLEKQAVLGERQFSCLFQQAPREQTGRMFDPRRLAAVDAVPAGMAVRAWDLAATDESSGGNPDWSVGLKLVRTDAGAFCIDDVIRFRRGPAAVAAAIRAAAERDGPEVAIGLPQDPGQAGRAQVMYLVQSLAGYRVTATPETGEKAVRARSVSANLENGLLSMRRAAWNAALLDEIAQFPHGSKDDQVDALSRAFGMFLELKPPARFARLAFSER